MTKTILPPINSFLQIVSAMRPNSICFAGVFLFTEAVMETGKIKNGMHGISRIDNKSHCWWVRLLYKNRRPTIQKSFSDVKYGGREPALLAAREYRDDHVESHNIVWKLKWKGRTSKEMRSIQKKHGRMVVKVGTGPAAARKAYDLGMSQVTCFKVSTGRQDTVEVAHGGWRSPVYEFTGFVNDISPADYEQIRGVVESNARSLSEVEKSEAVSDIMILAASGEYGHIINMETFSSKILAIRMRRKRDTRSRNLSLDANGDIERRDCP